MQLLGVLEFSGLFDMGLVMRVKVIVIEEIIVLLLVFIDDTGDVLVKFLVGEVCVGVFPKLFFSLHVFLLEEMNLLDDFLQFAFVFVEAQLGIDELLGLSWGFGL